MTLKQALLGAALLAVSAAHAATTIETDGFRLAHVDMPYPIDMAVLSAVGGEVRIAVRGWQPQINPAWVVAADELPQTEWDIGGGLLQASVTAGYRITSMTLAGTVTGALETAPLDSQCGSAQLACARGTAANQATVDMSVLRNGTATGPALWRLDNAQGTQAYSLTANQPLTGEFELAVDTYGVAFATAGVEDRLGNISYVPSRASLGFGDMILTVQVSPVPEPGTYAMLLGGLGLLGVAARRRQR